MGDLGASPGIRARAQSHTKIIATKLISYENRCCYLVACIKRAARCDWPNHFNVRLLVHLRLTRCGSCLTKTRSPVLNNPPLDILNIIRI